MICNELLRVLIHFLPDAQIRRPPRRVVCRMRLALMFGQREQRRIPAVGSQTSRIIDGKAEIVADFRTRNALRLVLVKSWSPFSGWINLCKRWNNSQGHHQQTYGVAHIHRSEEHTSELQSPCNLVCRLLLEKKKKNTS